MQVGLVFRQTRRPPPGDGLETGSASPKSFQRERRAARNCSRPPTEGSAAAEKVYTGAAATQSYP